MEKYSVKSDENSETANRTNVDAEEDPIETCIGPFGTYQLFTYLIMLVARLPTDYQLTNVVFLIPPAVYTCSNQTALCPCDNPVYDTSTFSSTIVTSWDLICERGWLASVSQAVYQTGVLAGSLAFSAISDRFGRKISIIGALFLCPLAAACSALSPHMWLLICLRFLTGAGVGGTMLCTFILNVEIVGKSFRPYMCGLDNLSYIIAFLTIPGIAYNLRDWRHLLLATSVPWLVLAVALYWVLPESPRWLIASGMKNEAVDLLKKIARRNSRPTDKIEATVDQFLKATEMKDQEKRNFSNLYTTASIRKFIVIMSFVWMMCSFGFFGVNQYFGRLGDNVYLNMFISACIHVPALCLSAFAALKFKRRPSLWISFGTAGVTLLSIIFVPRSLEIVRIVIGAVGVSSMFVSFTLIYLFSSELFPTVVRNSAMGVASMFARVGAFIAPFVVDIGEEWASLLIFSSAAIFAAVSCYFLTETKDIVLRNHVKQTK